MLTAIQVSGALVGAVAGRPLARLFVRMFVPPGWRSPLAFLWAADGKRLSCTVETGVSRPRPAKNGQQSRAAGQAVDAS